MEKGLPHYDDTDIFVLSGAEHLVPVPGVRLASLVTNPRLRDSLRASSITPD
jgi:hypothetical protein